MGEGKEREEYFPDGKTVIGDWFRDDRVPQLSDLGKQYVLNRYGVLCDGRVYTKQIQALIDRVHEEGGGVVVVPEGTYMTGALYFKQGVNLYLSKGAVLKGSDDISDYNVCTTRIEGETCLYFDALINACGLDGFTIAGPGVIDGNGLRIWKAFWLRRKWNPACTNKDEQRPRLIYLSGCKNVTVAQVTLMNSQFWTNHMYKCDHVRYLECSIIGAREPIAAPSTDAMDIDACEDVLIKRCRMNVNDDAIGLKGGKGPWADEDENNGGNERILVEDCSFDFCHGALVFGSESIHDKNILFRNSHVGSAFNVLWFKLRPDTPQHYEYVKISHIDGETANFLNINPWSQFFDLKGRTDMPVSNVHDIMVEDCSFSCDTFLNIRPDEKRFHLKGFSLERLDISAFNSSYDEEAIEELSLKDVKITKKEKISFPDSIATMDGDEYLK